MFWARNDGVGGQAIEDVSLTQMHPLGMYIETQDPTGRTAEFVYIRGTNGGAPGLAVIYNLVTGETELTKQNTIGLIALLISPLSSNTQYGWAMVRGAAPARAAPGGAPGRPVYLSNTHGVVTSNPSSRDEILGASFAVTQPPSVALFLGPLISIFKVPVNDLAVLSLRSPYLGVRPSAVQLPAEPPIETVE